MSKWLRECPRPAAWHSVSSVCADTDTGSGGTAARPRGCARPPSSPCRQDRGCHSGAPCTYCTDCVRSGTAGWEASVTRNTPDTPACSWGLPWVLGRCPSLALPDSTSRSSCEIPPKTTLGPAARHSSDYIRGYIQKSPDWVHNEIKNNNNKNSLRSNTKGNGSKTH
jgi:hypothetical protein